MAIFFAPTLQKDGQQITHAIFAIPATTFGNFQMNTNLLKKVFITALMAMCSSGAMAWTPEWWGFSWKGFIQPDGRFDPNDTITGWFTGQDANHDNKIELNELTGLEISNVGFNFSQVNFSSCTPPRNDGAVSTCSISAFTYEIGGAMDFSATRNDHWDYHGSIADERLTYVAGSYVQWAHTTSWVSFVVNKQFSPQTITTITSVPEPETYAMLCAGLALLAGRYARKKT